MTTTKFAPFPRLVGDIGGTHARFAVIPTDGARPARIRSLACDEHAGLQDAIRAYLALERLVLPRVAAFGIANPVTGDAVAMTNRRWAFSIDALRAGLGLERLLVMNDFTALALSLPRLGARERRPLGGGSPASHRPLALLGPGTGLGVSGLVPCHDDYVPLEGEGGHVTLAASDAREAQIITLLAARFGHVSAERALSGAGLVAVYEAICTLAGATPEARTPAQIGAAARARRCPHCVETLERFAAMLGTVAADLALTLGARGGVYIGGGIVPRLGQAFPAATFRRRFEDKGRFSSYLARIPTYVIEAPHAALIGAGCALDGGYGVGHDARSASAA